MWSPTTRTEGLLLHFGSFVFGGLVVVAVLFGGFVESVGDF